MKYLRMMWVFVVLAVVLLGWPARGDISVGPGTTHFSTLDNPTYVAMQKALGAGGTYSNFNMLNLTNTMAKLRAGKSPWVVRVTGGWGGATAPGVLDYGTRQLTNFWGPLVGWVGANSYPTFRVTSYTGTISTNYGYGAEHSRFFFPACPILVDQNDTITLASDNQEVQGNVAFVVYAKKTGCGSIKIETNWNGGAFATATTVNADVGAVYTSGIFWVTNGAVGNPAIRLTQMSAAKPSAYFPFIGILDNTRQGVVLINQGGSGSDQMDDIAGTNVVFRNSCWSNLQPDLVLCSQLSILDGDSGADENAAGATYTNFTAYVDMWMTNQNMATDFVFVSSPLEADTGSPRVTAFYKARTNIVGAKTGRVTAALGTVAYVDNTNPWGNFAERVRRGWCVASDNAHMTGIFFSQAYDPYWVHVLRPEVWNQK